MLAKRASLEHLMGIWSKLEDSAHCQLWTDGFPYKKIADIYGVQAVKANAVYMKCIRQIITFRTYQCLLVGQPVCVFFQNVLGFRGELDSILNEWISKLSVHSTHKLSFLVELLVSLRRYKQAARLCKSFTDKFRYRPDRGVDGNPYRAYMSIPGCEASAVIFSLNRLLIGKPESVSGLLSDIGRTMGFWKLLDISRAILEKDLVQEPEIKKAFADEVHSLALRLQSKLRSLLPQLQRVKNARDIKAQRALVMSFVELGFENHSMPCDREKSRIFRIIKSMQGTRRSAAWFQVEIEKCIEKVEKWVPKHEKLGS